MCILVMNLFQINLELGIFIHNEHVILVKRNMVEKTLISNQICIFAHLIEQSSDDELVAVRHGAGHWGLPAGVDKVDISLHLQQTLHAL